MTSDPNTPPAFEMVGVDVRYKGRQGEPIAALSGVTLTARRGERIAMVGRSGAGKSTVARLACGLVSPTVGSVSVLGTPLTGVSKRELRSVRRRIHMVFQDPYQSLHPGQRVRDIVAEPLAISRPREDPSSAVESALVNVGLTPPAAFVDRRPGSLSGGQRQRVAIARALVAKPELILADEPTSMLDASLRATIANMLLALQQANDAAMLFITHDLALARQVADRIIVLERGAIVEDRPTEILLGDPHHPETKQLLAAAKQQSTADA